MKKYSAGIVHKGFWFLEFKKYFELEREGKTKAEIKELQLKENIFAAPSADYGKNMFSDVAKRNAAVPIEIKNIFDQLDVENQKLVVLFAIMRTDLLFFEFVYHACREDKIIFNKEYSKLVAINFFKIKQSQDEEAARFTDATVNRMCGAYGTYLRQAGYTIEASDSKKMLYKNIVLDYRLNEILKKEELSPYYKAILGVR